METNLFFLNNEKDILIINNSNQSLKELMYSTWLLSFYEGCLLMGTKYFYKISEIPPKSAIKVNKKDFFHGNFYQLENGNEERLIDEYDVKDFNNQDALDDIPISLIKKELGYTRSLHYKK